VLEFFPHRVRALLQVKPALEVYLALVNRGLHTGETTLTAEPRRAVSVLLKDHLEGVVDTVQTSLAIRTDMAEADHLAAIHMPASNRPAVRHGKEVMVD
jgi:hypothetical protein